MDQAGRLHPAHASAEVRQQFDRHAVLAQQGNARRPAAAQRHADQNGVVAEIDGIGPRRDEQPSGEATQPFDLVELPPRLRETNDARG